jgi:hypothetical protein
MLDATTGLAMRQKKHTMRLISFGCQIGKWRPKKDSRGTPLLLSRAVRAD